MEINKEQRLYVIPCGNGYTSLGFDVLDKRASAFAKELNFEWKERKGTKKAYNHYMLLLTQAEKKFKQTGWKSTTELHPQLIGLENCRIEVIDEDGLKYRFNVGKSTGYIPCHLQIHNARSLGGCPVDSRPFKSVTVIIRG